jgi:uncharacterized alpha-E superfamily protein
MLLPHADMVNTPIDNIQWSAVLKSASAFEMYRKKYHHIAPKKVAEFLIFDDHFPRAIRHCVSKAQISLHRITGTPLGAAGSIAEKRLGRLKADLDYTDIDEVIAQGMHEYLDRFQSRLNAVGDAIGQTFFNLRPLIEAVESNQ